MTSRSHATIASVLALSLLAAACGPAGDGEAENTADAPGATAATAEGTSAEPEGWLGEIHVGDAVDPQGAVPADRATTTFTPGDSVYVSMAIEGAPANAAVHAVFYDEANDKVAEDEKKVPAEARYLYFDAGDTSNWLPGQYRVELAVDGEVRSEETLTVTEAGEGGDDANEPAA